MAQPDPVSDLADAFGATLTTRPQRTLSTVRLAAERAFWRLVEAQAGGKVGEAARIAGTSRQTAALALARHGKEAGR